MTYLDSITLTRTLPCLAAPGRIIVIGKPARTLEEVLPYLATLPGIIAYNPEQCTLTFRRQPGFLTVQRDQVYITQVKNVQEGLELLAALTESINAVWEHRQELVAVMTAKRTPRPLDVWSLLPQTNCKQCGEQTCMAFAVGLLQETRRLEECLVLQSETHLADRRTTLMTMLPTP
jgi:ArsR family metal-binding transcriptional regulator